MNNFLPGTNFGLPDSVLVHPWANIVGRIECGEHCRIDAFVTITGNVKLGSRVHIGTGASLFGGGTITIGDDTGISPGVTMFTTSDGNPQVEHETTNAPITIGNSCLVGTNTVIMPGAVVEDHSKIGALSLVKGRCEAGLYVGIPVRRLAR